MAGGLLDRAAEAFGVSMPLAERYAGWLVGAGVERGVIGPREGARIWDRHILDCVPLASLVSPGIAVIDLGSGAGLPGVVLALLRPDLRLTLVDAQRRRCDFLREVLRDLDLGEVEVVWARAESLQGRAVPVVTARAVAPLDRLGAWALPLLSPGGRLLAMKGAAAQDEVTASAAELRRRGAAAVDVVHLPAVAQGATTVVVVTKEEATRAGRWRRSPPGPPRDRG